MHLRVATFNLENFDETAPGAKPSLSERIALMRPQIQRLRADVVCFQEVHGQERPGQPRALLALRELLAGTNLETATLTSSVGPDGEVLDLRNVVVASLLPVLGHEQYRNDLVPAPLYRQITAVPAPKKAVAVTVERPVLHVRLDLGAAGVLHVIDVHLKSKLPTDVPGQKADQFTWRTPGGWAEGSFLSSMKRVSQAVEVRLLVDRILDDDPAAKIVVAGDFNSTSDEVPVQVIRGNVEDTGNPAHATRTLVPLENSVPEPARFTLFHQGRGQQLDHVLVTRNLLAGYRGTQIHNELLHDESAAFATDDKYPESDHAPVVAEFDLPD